MLIICARCSRTADKAAGVVNRSRRAGHPVYCGRECSGLARRTDKTGAQKREEKRAYDIEYRSQNRAMLKVKKAAYHKRTYDPLKASVDRQKRMPKHVEYCRRPEYVEWKREYDRQYRAFREYGEYAECFLLVMDIRNECLSQQSDYEIRLAKGTLCKSQKRKRDHARTLRKEPEVGPLGNLEFRQGRQNGSLTS